jgi:hypothetical protein
MSEHVLKLCFVQISLQCNKEFLRAEKIAQKLRYLNLGVFYKFLNLINDEDVISEASL